MQDMRTEVFGRSLGTQCWRLSLVLLFGFLSVALCQPRKNARRIESDIPVLNYEHVDWPTDATSVAGFPAGPWNFIQVPAVAAGANGNLLLLHRGAYPVMEFRPDGMFVRAWGDGMFSQGKVVFVPQANRNSDRSYYSAVYGPAACTNGGVHSVRVDRQKNIWLVDATGHIIFKMDPQGKDILM